MTLSSTVRMLAEWEHLWTMCSPSASSDDRFSQQAPDNNATARRCGACAALQLRCSVRRTVRHLEVSSPRAVGQGKAVMKRTRSVEDMMTVERMTAVEMITVKTTAASNGGADRKRWH